MPTDPWEKSQVMVVIEALREMDPTAEQWFFEKDKARKAVLFDKLSKEIIPAIIGKVEKLLKGNKNGEGWFVGDKVTFADVIVFNTLFDGLPSFIEKGQGEYPLDDYPLLKAHSERFHALPQIKKWIEARPVTQF
ncbi:Glutathione S-transferase 1 [Holothuria leucospilota]|uniref:glutathione transferase n=1 Tax=Holothuria leucospilota TaxID=206669 RepID=A0A9Q0YI37_HOLLE|nr:Glutathione S-transferase 1 [Holothuria leucospilota]